MCHFVDRDFPHHLANAAFRKPPALRKAQNFLYTPRMLDRPNDNFRWREAEVKARIKVSEQGPRLAEAELNISLQRLEGTHRLWTRLLWILLGVLLVSVLILISVHLGHETTLVPNGPS
jgi:hypothetical protein